MSHQFSLAGMEDMLTKLSGQRGLKDEPLSWAHQYPLENVDHPLKGLLKDKGGSELLQELELIEQYYNDVYHLLNRIVKERNQRHPTGGLATLSIQQRKVIFWRTTRQLDILVDEATHRYGRYYLFNPQCEQYEVVANALKEHAPDLYHFYLAVDAVRSDLDFRLKANAALMRTVMQCNENVMVEPSFKVRERRELVNVLGELNQKIRTQLF